MVFCREEIHCGLYFQELTHGALGAKQREPQLRLRPSPGRQPAALGMTAKGKDAQAGVPIPPPPVSVSDGDGRSPASPRESRSHAPFAENANRCGTNWDQPRFPDAGSVGGVPGFGEVQHTVERDSSDHKTIPRMTVLDAKSHSLSDDSGRQRPATIKGRQN